MKKVINICLATLFIFAACKSKSNNDESLFNEATQLAKDGKFPMAIVKYESIVKDFPKSDYCPTSIYKLASIYNSNVITTNSRIDNCKKAVYYYNKYNNEFTNAANSAECMFHSGYIYANELKILDSAKIKYEELIKKYPDSEYAGLAKPELQNIGKTPDEIIDGHK